MEINLVFSCLVFIKGLTRIDKGQYLVLSHHDFSLNIKFQCVMAFP